MMNDDQLLRYSRQIMLPGFDYGGQQRLLTSKVLIVGMGGLGSAVSMYLASAGIGELTLADDDTVDLSNLQRQVVFSTDDIGCNKAIAAKARLALLNPEIAIHAMDIRLEEAVLTSAVQAADIVVDASDNFQSRFAINAACVRMGRPLVSGAAIRGEGQLIVFNSAKGSACYRCLFDDAVNDAALSCSESGVVAPLVGIVGTMQAMEVIRLASDWGEQRLGVLQTFDAVTMMWNSFSVTRDPQCPVCC